MININSSPVVMTVANYVKFMINALMIVGPCLGYIIQAEKFKTIHSSKGFSLYVCLVILISNVLRIFFWVGKRFSTILLAQSFVIIACQLYLIYVALENSELRMTITSKPNDRGYAKEKERNLFVFLYNNCRNVHKTLFSIETFWKWESFSLYVLMTILGTIAIGVICLLFGFENKPFIELIGSISTGIEVILAIPQIASNYQNKSTEALSFLMILTWLIGDSFKIGYYIVMQLPIQFIVCSLIQIGFDIILVSQIMYYDYYTQKSNQPNGLIYKDSKHNDKGYGTFTHSLEDEDGQEGEGEGEEDQTITIKRKLADDDDDILIKDYS